MRINCLTPAAYDYAHAEQSPACRAHSHLYQLCKVFATDNDHVEPLIPVFSTSHQFVIDF